MNEDWGTVGKPGSASKGQDAAPLRKKGPADQAKPGREEERVKAGPAGSAETDLVIISGPARQIAKLREQIDREPSVRSEKVLEIKTRVHRGEYHVPAKEILKKMVEQAISEARGNRGKR